MCFFLFLFFKAVLGIEPGPHVCQEHATYELYAQTFKKVRFSKMYLVLFVHRPQETHHLGIQCFNSFFLAFAMIFLTLTLPAVVPGYSLKLSHRPSLSVTSGSHWVGEKPLDNSATVRSAQPHMGNSLRLHQFFIHRRGPDCLAYMALPVVDVDNVLSHTVRAVL